VGGSDQETQETEANDQPTQAGMLLQPMSLLVLGWFETAGFPHKQGGAKTLFILFIFIYLEFISILPKHQPKSPVKNWFIDGFGFWL
jgi:hypothetical protein